MESLDYFIVVYFAFHLIPKVAALTNLLLLTTRTDTPQNAKARRNIKTVWFAFLFYKQGIFHTFVSKKLTNLDFLLLSLHLIVVFFPSGNFAFPSLSPWYKEKGK